ncbi:MAG: ABC transporter ATP-binding protein/permease [Rhodocyclaceae bacterium]|jgi:putative ATP-binding cassette transporter|nr:ABC transporter ATP-binding protein/permease [Rhodocyclaceae bacterium]
MPTRLLEFLRLFWRLACPYWKSEERGMAWLLLCAVVALNLASVFMLVQVNAWYNSFYNAIQDYDRPGFVALLWYFLLLAAVYILIVVYQLYLNQMLQVRWRRWLTTRYIERWLSGQAYYRVQLLDAGTGAGTDNPDQRISEDLRLMCDQTLEIGLGLMNAIVTLASFVVVLWSLSGPATVSIGGIELTVPGYMVWAAVAYAAIGTWLANLIGRPLARLTFEQQRHEADFRYGLMRLRENSESVALYRGEAGERARLGARFGAVFANYWQLMRRQKKLTWFSNGYNQLATVFPFVVSAPRYFAKEIQLGGLMQISSAFGQVHGALSYLINAYPAIAAWKATVDRLTGFEQRMLDSEQRTRRADRFLFCEGARTTVSAQPEAGTGQASAVPVLSVRGLDVALPDGRLLVAGLDLDIRAGDALLVSGPSGSGKSTLLRALAGIWPYGQGEVTLPPRGEVLFLPQKPYLPSGTLREALCYPGAAVPADDPRFESVLERCGLGHFTARLDQSDLWAQVLSGGEQQRVAFARALLLEPTLLFLDESTSALDEPSEEALHGLLVQALPDTTIVSVGHRRTLWRWHRNRLSSMGHGLWELAPLSPSGR